MSENLSAKYYHKNKERLQKKLVKDIKIFWKKKKEKKATTWSWTLQKSLRRWKNKLVEYRKNIIKWEKLPDTI